MFKMNLFKKIERKNKGKIHPHIDFPIAILNDKDSNIEVFLSKKYYLRLPEVSADIEMQKGHYVVDSNGGVYKVIKIEKLGYVNFLKGFDPVFGKTVFVNEDLELIRNYTLENLKREIVKRIKGDEDLLINMDIKLSDMIEDINKASSIKDVFLSVHHCIIHED